jgi:hypothetical protein
MAMHSKEEATAGQVVLAEFHVLPLHLNGSNDGAERSESQWLRLALSKGPSRIGVSILSSRNGNIQFPKLRVFYYLEFQTIDKVHKHSDSEYSCICVVGEKKITNIFGIVII